MRRMTKTVVIAGGLMLAAAPAFAVDLQASPSINTIPSPQILRQQPFDDLLILQNRQRRYDFQREQQWNREQDRQAVPVPGRQPEVPVMGRRCPIQVFGNRYVRVCR